MYLNFTLANKIEKVKWGQGKCFEGNIMNFGMFVMACKYMYLDLVLELPGK